VGINVHTGGGFKMKKGTFRILAIAVVFAMLIPSVSMVGMDRSEDEVVIARVMFPGSSPSEMNYADYVERVIAPYEGFIMAELSQKQIDHLEARGATVIVEKNLFSIGIDGYTFDTRSGEPKIKEALGYTPRTGTEGSYLVQFVGPIKSEWLETIENMGAENIFYYPYNAMLVKATPELKSTLEGLGFVQWIGSYHPAYKIRPSLTELRSGETRDVKIITYEAEGVESVLSTIDESDVILSYGGRDFGLIKATLGIADIERIATMSQVSYIEPIYEIMPTNAKLQWLMQTNITDDRRLWGLGINGSTQIITVADTGLDYDHNMFRESPGVIQSGDIFNVTEPSRRKLIRYQPMAEWFDARGIDRDGDGLPEMQEDFDGDGILEAVSDSSTFAGFSGHGTTTTATHAGNDTTVGVSINDGVAAGAQIYFQDVAGKGIDSQTGLPRDMFWWVPDDYYYLFIDPYKNGSRVHANSWGADNNEYDLEAMMIDKFMWDYPEFLVLYPTGNTGVSGGPGSPSTAKNIVSAGWTNTAPQQNNVISGSSKGPTADGRRSPTMVAPGVASMAVSTGNPLDDMITDMEGPSQGGSYASQALGGAATLIRDYFAQGFYPNGSALPGNEFYPTAALVKAALMASGEMMSGNFADQKGESTYPNNSQGWGRPILDDLLYFTGDTRELLIIDNTEGINTGEVVEYEFNITSDTDQLKFFLAWSDYPAAVGASPAIVNNLDLEVEAPNGTTFKGNRFASSPPSPSMWKTRGFSLPGGAFDTVNTDEGVIITPGNAVVDNWVTTGVWTARIIAQNVPVGAQPFGLVVTGELELGYGIVTTDRKVYSAYDTINIEVRDTNALAPLTVNVNSTSETTPESVILTEVVLGAGIWTGSINTEFGFQIADGILQVREGDDITVCYDDANPVHTNCATAVVDSSGPIITNVGVKDLTNAVATVIWDTDEPSTSKVYYGETPSLEKTPVEFTGLMVNHEVQLIGLKTDTLYYYDVESADRYGHTTRDTNGGSHYTFRTTEAAEILVIFGESIGTEDETFDKHDYYRNALDAFGWSYNEWYADAFGDPPLSLLQEYKVVIWQPGYEQYPAFSETQQPIVTSYLDGGGRLFISSHDVAWGMNDQASQFFTPERSQWFNSTMKVRYKEDLIFGGSTVIKGIAGNIISGGYATSPYPLYQAHRDGALGDEVECIGADGICVYTWNSEVDILNPTSGPIAIQWTSFAVNGTPGVGVYGGKVSKMVAYFFEWTRIEPSLPNSAKRADILDKTIIWLIGRDHPDVLVTAPDGGETFTTSPVTITWNVAPLVGTEIATQTLFYSDNAGQSWKYLDTRDNSTFFYDWPINAVPNGNKYMVKVKVEDNGDPSLFGSDESNSTFTILRPGGDTEGPITIPGSINAFPNFIDSGQPMWLNATVDDSNKGNSNIATAEYFIQCTEPAVTDYGTGTAMTASDGTFNNPVEDVTWTGTLGFTSGWYTFWVHGQDQWNNWGPFESERFLVLDGVNPVDLVAPAEPTNVDIVFEPGLADLRISWDASADDDGNPVNVEYYDIFYSEAYVSGGTGYKILTSLPATAAASYFLIHLSGGVGDPKSYFYYIGARDQSCNYGVNSTQVSKYNRDLTTGKNLVSIPLIMADTTITTVLQTAAYDAAWYYDATDIIDPWKSYNPSKTFNDLANVNMTMALWIHTSVATSIVVVGKVPTNETIQLVQGWNFVGYPSMLVRNVGLALTIVGYERVEGYSMALPQNLKIYTDLDNMEPGYGYWVKATGAGPWNVKE